MVCNAPTEVSVITDVFLNGSMTREKFQVELCRTHAEEYHG